MMHDVAQSDQHAPRVFFTRLDQGNGRRCYFVALCMDGKHIRETSRVRFGIMFVTPHMMRLERVEVAWRPADMTEDAWMDVLHVHCASMGVDSSAIDRLGKNV